MMFFFYNISTTNYFVYPCGGGAQVGKWSALPMWVIRRKYISLAYYFAMLMHLYMISRIMAKVALILFYIIMQKED